MKYRHWIIFILVLATAASSWAYVISSIITNRDALLIQVADIADAVALPYRIARLSQEPRDTELLVPLRDIAKQDTVDSWGGPRSGGRSHEGVDIFAPRGTPVYAVADGFVLRTGTNTLGGIFVFTIGAGGVRYYYAHLDRIAEGMEYGTPVTTDTVLGFVGNTGNAEGTDPHLHLGMYAEGGAQNPYPLLTDR